MSKITMNVRYAWRSDEMKKDKDLTKENCFNCGKIINLKRKHHTVLYNREKVEQTPKCIEVDIEYSEPLGYFCTKKCFKEFLSKHKIKHRKGV